MGRSLIFERQHEAKIEEIIDLQVKHPKVPNVYFLIGHVNSTGYFVAHIAQCPKPMAIENEGLV